MSHNYHDERIAVDAQRIQIRSMFKTREIPLSEIRSARLIDLGLSRYRLVGIGPKRPRTWFTADPHRRHRRQGIELDIGKTLRIGITPERPQAALDAITKHHQPPQQPHKE